VRLEPSLSCLVLVQDYTVVLNLNPAINKNIRPIRGSEKLFRVAGLVLRGSN
jgi:hypothetical protein